MTLIQEHRSPMLDEVAVVFTLIGEFRNMLIFSALLVALLLITRQWRQAVFACSTLLFTALANTVTKHFFARVRPEVLSDPLTSYSMPSGHASGSFALFLTLAVLAGRGQPPRMRLTWLLVGACRRWRLPVAGVSRCSLADGCAGWRDAGGMRLRGQPVADVSAGALNPLPSKIWWLILPSLVALFGFFVLRHLPHTMLRYAY
jgi:membrane-associated phospholipid phosphatase